MRPVNARLVMCALIVIGVLGSAGGARAEAQAYAVAAEDCTIEPVRMPQPGEVGNLATPAPPPTPIVIDGGAPADEATVAAVSERIAMAIACHNAGDVLSMLANFSDRWVEERFSGYDLVFYGRFQVAAQNPEPLAEEDQLGLLSIDEVVVLDDGRVAATVMTSLHGENQISRLVLVRESGEWLIDGGDVSPR